MPRIGNMLIRELLGAYRQRILRPTQVVEKILELHGKGPDLNAWVVPPEAGPLLARARTLEATASLELPLYGIPFAVKDNIDLAGVDTTAGCPAFAYRPSRSAPVVEHLLANGAIAVGKTHLDQFATGLTGTRSPQGPCRNPFDASYVAGGSSSGSAVAVATGLASFALGTDTAGSGRVPAAFNNLVGLKPTRGRLSARGVVPACRTLDCVSILALTAADAARVLAVVEGYDELDPFSRTEAAPRRLSSCAGHFRFAVPRPDELEFLEDREYARLFAEATSRLSALGGRQVEIDLRPFLEATRLLYDGPWTAERYAAVGEFVSAHPEHCHPVTRAIISSGSRPTAVDAFRAQYRLAELRRMSESTFRQAEVLLVPTTPTICRLAEVEADPVALNSKLGRYTQFVNLLDLSAVAVPSGFRNDGLPFGVTLLGPAWSDGDLLQLAHRFHAAARLPLGAVAAPFPDGDGVPAASGGELMLSVCGAHMEGLPLAHELLSRGARLSVRTRTAPHYRLYALPGGPPARPGLVRVAEGGASIEVEVWALPLAEVGSFLQGLPAPLAIGKVELHDGSWVSGFICEGVGLVGAHDVTDRGGWRAYLDEGGARL